MHSDETMNETVPQPRTRERRVRGRLPECINFPRKSWPFTFHRKVRHSGRQVSQLSLFVFGELIKVTTEFTWNHCGQPRKINIKHWFWNMLNVQAAGKHFDLWKSKSYVIDRVKSHSVNISHRLSRPSDVEIQISWESWMGPRFLPSVRVTIH